MTIESPGMPYDFAELEPAMSRDAVVFHFLRHQRVCFDRMRALAHGARLEQLALEELIRVSEPNPALRALHDYAAEVWNHNLFWRSMRPGGGGAAHGPIAEQLRSRFGSYERFAHDFEAAAREHFGSGWLWLVWRNGALEIDATANAATPLTRGDTALLALDLWEHAYYLDHQNRRSAYVRTFLEDLVNWEFANTLLAPLTAAQVTAAQLPAAQLAPARALWPRPKVDTDHRPEPP